MATIIGPDGRTYYSDDHRTTSPSGKNSFESIRDTISQGGSGIMGYIGLIGGIIALVIGIALLAELALGVLLLFIGSTSINHWMMKRRK